MLKALYQNYCTYMIINEIKSYFNRMIKSYLNFYEINKKVNYDVEYSIDGEIQINVSYE